MSDRMFWQRWPTTAPVEGFTRYHLFREGDVTRTLCGRRPRHDVTIQDTGEYPPEEERCSLCARIEERSGVSGGEKNNGIEGVIAELQATPEFVLDVMSVARRMSGDLPSLSMGEKLLLIQQIDRALQQAEDYMRACERLRRRLQRLPAIPSKEPPVGF